MRAARRAVALTLEAVLLSLVLTAIIAVGAYYVLSSFASQHVTVRDTVVMADYCGELLYVENTGTHTAVIENILTPNASQASATITFPYYFQLGPLLPYYLPPGSYIVIKTGVYPYLTIIGDNFAPVHVDNGCLTAGAAG